MQEDLRTYYNYLYPFDTLVDWLTYNKKYILAHRELSFEFQNGGVKRYVVFTDAKAMKERMINSKENIPLKVDAGAIWNRVPQKESNGKTVQRELIFDFDMNDYDDVRTCCEGKRVCQKCWKLLVIAVQVIEKALAEDFDLHKLMFVFSGGRGLHIWVCDQRARQLKDPARKAIIDYMELVTGNDKADSLLSDRVIEKYQIKKQDKKSRDEIKRNHMRNFVSQHVERSLQIIRQQFISIMTEQQIFRHQKCVDLMLKIIANRNQKLRDNVMALWTDCRNKSVEQNFREMTYQIIKFEMSETPIDYANGRKNGDKVYRLTFIEEEIMLSFLYPRMDYNVSTMQNHLLKLPFSVHPSTHNISIPLFKRQLKGWNPKTCVKLEQLLKDLDYDHLSDHNQINAMSSWLRQPIEAMQEFCATLQ